jgi:hypothetical protein
LESPLILKDMPKTTAVVLKNSEPLLCKGCIVWLNNYCPSPSLAKVRKSCNASFVGSMKHDKGRLFATVRTLMLLCAFVGVLGPTTQNFLYCKIRIDNLESVEN